ncbi:MAG: T9SS type A sorting domain-containing protein, partial [Bacteroidota bacterium]
DMQWTTGHSSGGQEGFGGQAATVGFNQGDGLRCFAYGIFDHEGTELVEQEASGLSHLDFRYIAWNGREAKLASESLLSPFSPSDTLSDIAFAFKAYPNPTRDHLMLDISIVEETEILIQLTDMSGRLVYHDQTKTVASDTRLEISTATLAKGLYYLSLHAQGQVWYQQIAKI